MTRRLRLALVTVPAILAAGLASGWLSGSGGGNPWYDALTKPAFTPPAWAFPVAWTTLYIMLGIALARVLALGPSPARTDGLKAFFAQLLLNLAWSPVFFGANKAAAALGIIVLMLGTAAVAAWRFGRLDRAAGWLMLPYLAWLCLALALNAEIVRLNP